MFTVECDDPFDFATPGIREAAEKAGCSWTPRTVVIDPTAELVDRADALSTDEVAEAVGFLVQDGILPADWERGRCDRHVPGDFGHEFVFTDDAWRRAAVKYGWALDHGRRLVAAAAPGSPFHLAFHRSAAPTTACEHLFLGLEFHRRDWQPATVAVRLPGCWEPAIDFECDTAELERVLSTHAGIARYCGSYRLRVPHATDKFSIIALLARACGDRLHLDLSDAPWLEAMRTLSRAEPAFFRQVLACAQEHFPIEVSGRCCFTTEEDVRSLPFCEDAALEALFLDDPRGRQLLHVTRGSILGEPSLAGRLSAAMARHAGLYSALAAARIARHLSLLHAAPQ